MTIQMLNDWRGYAAEQGSGFPHVSAPSSKYGTDTVALTTLMYVSTSRLEQATATRSVEAIITQAQARNSKAGISGALLFTGKHFVQVLEGDAVAIDALTAKLYVDDRHEKLIVVSRGPLAERLFADWALAYSGAAHFVNRRVTPLLDTANPAEQRRAVLALADVMYRFTKG